jgi:4'-phosphopantetheinyl transferase
MEQPNAWLLNLSSLAEEIPTQWFNRLSDDEKQRANSLTHTQRRRNYIASHALAYWALESFYGIENIGWHIASEGQPKVSHNFLTDNLIPQISLSHSGNLVLCAISSANTLIGCDIENRKARHNALPIAKHFFTEIEYQHLLQLQESNQAAELENYFYQCWTGKEAWLKAQGLGIANGLKLISVLPAEFTLADKDLENWQLHTTGNEQYCLSIALRTAKNNLPVETVLLNEARWDSTNFCPGKTLHSLRQLAANSKFD